ncbi:hypothetical protein RR48_01570 [Papilio machaon]|uniref:Uncharacterized protein n=1 Tax=Papilio machaon TaxID=76193 RepID=A0A0N1IAI6_PAPMA|nr:hypothetical protein RR48_01570 [Papilio machaon]
MPDPIWRIACLRQLYVDGIPHYDVNTAKEKERIKKMETGFLSMLSMKGVKYIFKRGYHWRTWRDIESEGNKTVICYKCKGLGNTSCKNCLNSGYWIMEEKPPPCPYEILSVSNNNQICSIYFAQWNDITSACPTLINLNDLLSVCDNPLETEWKITSKYNDLESETTLADICKGRESCRILTLYTRGRPGKRWMDYVKGDMIKEVTMEMTADRLIWKTVTCTDPT